METNFYTQGQSAPAYRCARGERRMDSINTNHSRIVRTTQRGNSTVHVASDCFKTPEEVSAILRRIATKAQAHLTAKALVNA